MDTISTKNVGINFAADATLRQKKKVLIQQHLKTFEQEGQNNPKFAVRVCYEYKGEPVIGITPLEAYGGKDIYIEFVDNFHIPQDSERTLWKWVYNEEADVEYPKSEPLAGTDLRMYLIPVDELINVNRHHNPRISDPKPVTPLVNLTPILEKDNNDEVAEVEEEATSDAKQEESPEIKEVTKEEPVKEIPEEQTSVATTPPVTDISLGDDVAGADLPYTKMSLRDYAAIQWKRPVSHKKWLNELIIKEFI